MKLMHIADLHLGAPCKSLGEMAGQRQRARDAAFMKLVDIAAREADMLIISGDLFDSHRPEDALVEAVKGGLSMLKGAGKPAIVVPGNHDEITYGDSVYRKPGWESCCHLVTEPKPAIVFEGEVCGERIAVCSCAYTGGITAETDLRDLPQAPGGAVGILALHATLDMDIPSKDRDRSMNISSADISSAGYKYAALGHIHAGSIKGSLGCIFAYPGLIEPSGFGDPEAKGYLTADISGGSCKAEWAPFPGSEAFRAVELDVTGLSADRAAENARLAAGKADYLQVRLKGTVSARFSAEEVRATLAPRYKYVTVESRAVGLDLEELGGSAGEHSVRGLFIRNMTSLIRAESGEERALLEKALWKGLEALRKEA